MTDTRYYIDAFYININFNCIICKAQLNDCIYWILWRYINNNYYYYYYYHYWIITAMSEGSSMRQHTGRNITRRPMIRYPGHCVNWLYGCTVRAVVNGWKAGCVNVNIVWFTNTRILRIRRRHILIRCVLSSWVWDVLIWNIILTTLCIFRRLQTARISRHWQQ